MGRLPAAVTPRMFCISAEITSPHSAVPAPAWWWPPKGLLGTPKSPCCTRKAKSFISRVVFHLKHVSVQNEVCKTVHFRTEPGSFHSFADKIIFLMEPGGPWAQGPSPDPEGASVCILQMSLLLPGGRGPVSLSSLSPRSWESLSHGHSHPQAVGGGFPERPHDHASVHSPI